MHHIIDQVRARFLRWLCEQDPSAASVPCAQTMLLRHGRLCGYRFTVGNASAEWNIGDSTFEARLPGRSATLLLMAVDQRAA